MNRHASIRCRRGCRREKLLRRLSAAGALCGIGLLLWSAPVINAQEPETSEVVDRDVAYRLLRRGDQARERRDWVVAVHAYQTALDMYRLLARQVPEWDRDFVTFRMDYCRRELALIEQETGDSVSTWLDRMGPSSPVDAERYRVLYRAMLEENRKLREQVDALETELLHYMDREAMEEEDGAPRGEREQVLSEQAASAEPSVGAAAEDVRPRPLPAAEERAPDRERVARDKPAVDQDRGAPVRKRLDPNAPIPLR